MKLLKSSLILSAAHLKVAFLKPFIEPATFNLTELSLGKFLVVNDNYFPWVTKILNTVYEHSR